MSNVDDKYIHNSLLENPLDVPKSTVGGLREVNFIFTKRISNYF